MNTLLVFLVRRDQVAQLVAYLLVGILVLALEFGRPGAAHTAMVDEEAVAAGSAGTPLLR